MKKKRYIKKFVKNNLKNSSKKPDFPQEASSDSMAIVKIDKKLLFRPNNYRRQIQFLKAVDSGYKTTIRKKLFKLGFKSSIGKRNKLLFVKNFKQNITIQLGKNKLSAIWSQNIIGGSKEIFLIKASSYSEVETRINEIKLNIESLIDSSLKDFLKISNIKYCDKPIWIRHEDFIKGEEFIDSIPKEVLIHDTVMKKVYPEGVEFIGGKNKEPTVYIKNYLKNRALEDFSPELVDAINNVNVRMDDLLIKFLPVQEQFSENIESHTRVVKGMVEGFDKFNSLLTNFKVSNNSSKYHSYSVVEKDLLWDSIMDGSFHR